MSLSSKTINGRIIQKHDTAANWAKAQSFIPKLGEIIIYDADQNNPQVRIKIGDGATNVNQLSFVEEIIDVIELPTTGISENITYRLLQGQFVSKGLFRYDSTCYIVEWDNTPSTTGESVLIETEDGLAFNGYYNKKNNTVYGYFATETADLLKARVDASNLSSFEKNLAKAAIGIIGTGWKTLEEIFNLVGSYTDMSYGGIVTSKIQINDVTKAYIYLTYADYIYRNNNWIQINDEILHGDGNSSEVFNSPLNIATGVTSHAEGYLTQALATQAHAEGYNTKASSMCSHTEGHYTYASGIGAHAEGYNDTKDTDGNEIDITTYGAHGNASHAEGVNTLSTGKGAHAEGRATTAISDYAHAEGYDTSAEGVGAHSEGRYSTAKGIGSHAEGGNTNAEGDYAHTEGHVTHTAANYAHAEGNNSHANGVSSHAEGEYSKANGKGAHSEGSNTIAEGNYSHTEGYSTTARGNNAHAEGGCNTVAPEFESTVTNDEIITQHKSTPFTLAKGNNSHSEGHSTMSLGIGGHSEGRFSVSVGDIAHAEGDKTYAYGIGAHSEGGSTNANGNYAHAEGYLTQADGKCSHAEGRNTLAVGENSHAEGYSSRDYDPTGKTIEEIIIDHDNLYGDENTPLTYELKHSFSLAYGVSSHTEGKDTLALGKYSHAEGENTVASGYASHAEGGGKETIDPTMLYITKASGAYSHAEGFGTEASGNGSHSEGSNTRAIGDDSHTEGYYTHASGIGAHAEGNSSHANGAFSHAEGHATSARGIGSHSEGSMTIASCDYQHVQGVANIIDEEHKYIHIVGNGVSADMDQFYRSNAHTLDWHGNAEYQGDVTAYGCGSEHNPISLKETHDSLPFLANYGTTSYDEIKLAFDNNRQISVKCEQGSSSVVSGLYDSEMNLLMSWSELLSIEVSWEYVGNDAGVDYDVRGTDKVIKVDSEGRLTTNYVSYGVANDANASSEYLNGKKTLVIDSSVKHVGREALACLDINVVFPEYVEIDEYTFWGTVSYSIANSIYVVIPDTATLPESNTIWIENGTVYCNKSDLYVAGIGTDGQVLPLADAPVIPNPASSNSGCCIANLDKYENDSFIFSVLNDTKLEIYNCSKDSGWSMSIADSFTIGEAVLIFDKSNKRLVLSFN